MLRGAIDFNDGWRIGGWIYSPDVPVAGRLLLAFVDDRCVGSGTVEVHRQDLADAGLGDGLCGFSFAITLPRIADRARVFVKLDWSDFALLQPHGRIVADGDATAAAPDPGDASIDWMRARGWIDAADAAFLRDLATSGIHAGTPGDRPSEAVRRRFELYRRAPVRVQEATIRLDNLAVERAHLVEGAALPIVAIHAPSGALSVGGGAPHDCTAERLLFADTRAPLAGTGDGTALIYRAV